MTTPPSTNGANRGRGPRGRFAPGNRFGRGNPFAQKVAKLRAALLRAVSAGNVRAIIKGLVVKAKAGDVAAAKLLLDRVLGPALPLDFEERLAQLEQILHEGER